MALGDPLSFTVRDNTDIDPDANGVGVIANGWIAEMVFEGLGLGGTLDPHKVHITVTDPGFNTDGTTTTRTRTFTGGKLLRRQWPNQAEMQLSVVGGNLHALFSLHDVIYAGSTVTVTAEAGAYTGSTAGTPAVTNSSERPYPKALIKWLNMPYERVASDHYYVEAVATHRHAMNGQQVACVKAYATDGTHISAEQIVGSVALSTILTSATKPEVYALNVPLASMNQGADCEIVFKVYPWLGDASAVLDTSIDGTAQPTARNLANLPFTCDKDGTWGGALAYVSTVQPVLISSGTFGGTYNYAGVVEPNPGTGFTAASYAFDGVANGTEWISTDNENVWLGVHFPSPTLIKEVRITMAASGAVAQPPSAFKLKFSDDGITWTDKGLGDIGTGAWTAGQTKTFNVDVGDDQPHRYWRIERNLSGGSLISIANLVFAKDAGGGSLVSPYTGTDATEARLRPHPTTGAALVALAAYNNTAFARNNHSGSTIYLMDASGADAEHHPTHCDTAAGQCWTDIKADPLATGKVTIANPTDVSYVPSMLRYKGPNLHGDVSSNYWMLCNDQVNGRFAVDGLNLFTHGGSDLAYQVGFFYVRNNVFTDAGQVTDNYNLAMFDGNTCAGTGQAVVRCAVGNNVPKWPFLTPAASRESNDGAVWVNNYFAYTGDPLSKESFVYGFGSLQNLVEPANIPYGQEGFALCADGVTFTCDNVVEMYDSVMGLKSNRFYNDGIAGEDPGRTPKSGVMRFNIWHDWNCKSDTQGHTSDPNDTGRVGNWEMHYNVGSVGNISIYGSKQGDEPGDGESYLGDYWPPNSEPNAYANSSVPTFVDDQTNRPKGSSSTGPGGGDYHPVGISNVAYARVPAGQAGLSFDLYGAPRRNDGTGAAGAFERTDATRLYLDGPLDGEVGTPAGPFTIHTNGVLGNNAIIALHDGGAGGSFRKADGTVISGLTLTQAQPTATFYYLPVAPGSIDLTLTNTVLLTNPDPLTLTAVLPDYELTGPTAAYAGVPATFTITVADTLLEDVHFTPSDGGHGGVFTPDLVTLAAGDHPTVTFTYTPAHIGVVSVGLANDGGLTDVEPITVSVASGTSQPAAEGPLDVLPEFMAIIPADATGPTAIEKMRDAGDRRPIGWDLAAELGDGEIDAIERIGPDAATAALGIYLEVGDRRPKIETPGRKRIEAHPLVDPAMQQDPRFSIPGGFKAKFTARVKFRGSNDAVERSVTVPYGDL